MAYRKQEPPPAGDAAHSPQLSSHQEQQAQESTSIAAPVLHEAIRREGDEELARPVSALAWSGLAAGLSMGFSLVAEGILHAHLPAGASWCTLDTPSASWW
jgi:hypothetical protein